MIWYRQNARYFLDYLRARLITHFAITVFLFYVALNNGYGNYNIASHLSVQLYQELLYIYGMHSWSSWPSDREGDSRSKV